MKRGLRVPLLVVLLLVLGVGVFIATFDADRYRPLLVSRLQEAVGRPVTLERLSLGWRNGIAVQLHRLAIADEGPRAAEPLLQVDSASALVRLWPLVRKEIQVASVTLSRPRVHLVRDAQGRINLLGLIAVASPAAGAAPQTAGGPSPGSFNIGSFRLDDGTLRWTDLSASPPTEVWMDEVVLLVRNIAPGEPMDIDLKAALGAKRQNLALSGRLTLPEGGQAGSLEQGRLTIEGLALQQVLPPRQPGAPQLQGTLGIAVEGTAPTLEAARVRETVTAGGRLTLTDARVANLNVLRAIFEKMSMIPGLLQRLEARLPEGYQAKLAAPDTVLSPIDVPLRVEAGALQLDDLRVRSDTFELSGTGRVGLSGAMEIRAAVRIDPQLSAALISSVNELQALADAGGQLEIPLTVQGQAPHVAVLPDLSYLASRLVATTVQDLLGNVLQKAIEKTAPQAPPQL
jgi:uncharacterized protein YhdP